MKNVAVAVGVALVALALLFAPGSSAQQGGSSPVPQPAANLPMVTQQPGPLPSTVAGGGVQKSGRLDSVLDHLYRVDAAARAAGRSSSAASLAASSPADIAGAITARQLRVDAGGRVQIWAQASGDVAAAQADLQALGMQVQRTDAGQKLVQGLLPIARLQQAAGLASVAAVRRPAYGVVQTGSVDSEGDSLLAASSFRTQLSHIGEGVKVGIISDGMEGLIASQGTGDLGTVDTTTCNVVAGDPSPTASGTGAEGTAMAEIVHDLAPGAQLMFGFYGNSIVGGGTALDFDAAVNCLAAANDIVVDDIGWFIQGPYDGTSFVSENTAAALANPANRIRGYYTAAGNKAATHYRATYVSSGFQTPPSPVSPPGGDFWVLNRFQASTATTDGGFGFPCATGIFCGNTVDIAPGGTLTVFLEWNDPFDTSSNDYDLLLFDNNAGTLTPVSGNFQDGTAGSDPVEAFAITNTGATDDLLGIAIGNYKGLAQAKTFDMFIICDCAAGFPTGLPAPDNISLLNFNTLSGSLPNQSDAGGQVIAVAAAGATTPGTIEPYSSRGPSGGNAKPDITGIDCVAITGAAGFPNPFCGTSAAAPHIAAIAALLLSCHRELLSGVKSALPAATARTTLHDALLNGAKDLGGAGTDNTYGHGRAEALVSAPLAGCNDTDADGCSDAGEVTLGLDSNDPWDFYSVPIPSLFNAPDPLNDFKDHTIAASDAQAVLSYFKAGAKTGKLEYDEDLNMNGIMDGVEYDRSVAGPGESGPPDGNIAASDAQTAFAQFKLGYHCSP